MTAATTHVKSQRPEIEKLPNGVPLWGIGFVIPAFTLLVIARWRGFIAHVPLILIFGELAVTLVSMGVLTSKYPPGTEKARPRLHMFAQIVLIGLILYTLGWGAILAVGFIFPATNIMNSDGSKYGPWAMGCVVSTVAVDEIGVSLGIFKSLVVGPRGYGLALLEVAGTCAAILILGYRQKEKERIQQSVIDSESRFRTLVQNASDIVAVVDASGCLSYVSPSFTRVLGWSVSDFDSRPASDLLHPDDLQRLMAQAPQSPGTPGQLIRSEFQLQHADGTWRCFEATVSYHLDDPTICGIVANLHDITERKSLEDELRHQALHDSLTGLANRALFTDRVEHALARQSRSGGTLAVLLVDLDDFKAINDSLGHEMGDRLLAEVALKLGGAVRASDTVARLGGDEFALLLEDPLRGEDPEEVAERIVGSFAEPIVMEDRSFVISASVGVELSSPETFGADELLRNADMAMYSAKSSGKGRWTRFEPPMHQAVQRRLELKTDLLEAISSGDQMELYYQPIVHLVTREITGLEALLRWNHPSQGLKEPLEFLSVAEDSGLIMALGRFALREAANQLSSWRSAHASVSGLSMSVNVSGRQLEDPRFVIDVREALEESGIEPCDLVLEITESVLMHETKETIARLAKLKRLGVRLAIDDFGTGYSSLSYLQHFPVDILKVDRSFISDIGDPSRRGALAEAVVGMGAILDLQTIAEGVELEEQAMRLPNLGCLYGQGFLFSTPLPASECEDLLREMAEAQGAPGRHFSEAQMEDLRSGACRGTLVFHKDSSVHCSERSCVTDRSSEKALGNHALIVTCQQEAHCLHCTAANEAIGKGPEWEPSKCPESRTTTFAK